MIWYINMIIQVWDYSEPMYTVEWKQLIKLYNENQL